MKLLILLLNFKGGITVKRRLKGEGTIRKRSDGRWEGRYIDSTGKTKSIYNTSKKQIREDLSELSYLKNTTHFDDVGGDIPLDTYFEHYIEVKQFTIKERSIFQIKLAYNNHIKPILGKKIVYSLNVNDVVAVKQALQKKRLSEVTQNNIMTHFRAMLNFATKEGMLKQNPFLYLANNKPEQKNPKHDLTDDEINYILNEAKLAKDKNDHIYIMLCTLIYTGMRVGELCGLRWNDIGGDFQYITIDESHTDTNFENTTKTRSSRRTIPLNEFLSQQYRNLFNEIKPTDIDDYIFRNKRKNPYTSNMIGKRLGFLKTQIKKKYGVDLMYVTPHYFRHTFATRGINNGVPIKDMQELLGHANARMLMDVYMHTTNQRKQDSINSIWKSMHIECK